MQIGDQVVATIKGHQNKGQRQIQGRVFAFLAAGESARLKLPSDMIGQNNNIKVNRFNSKPVDFDNDRILLELDTVPVKYHAVKKEQIEVIK